MIEGMSSSTTAFPILLELQEISYQHLVNLVLAPVDPKSLPAPFLTPPGGNSKFIAPTNLQSSFPSDQPKLVPE